LEENVRRKDLTPFELSKNIVALAETAATVLQSEFLSKNDKNPKGGRPHKADSEEKISERTGVPQPRINEARRHVAAVEKYPELAALIPTQKDAITVANFGKGW
jgi:hypothetical protein